MNPSAETLVLTSFFYYGTHIFPFFYTKLLILPFIINLRKTIRFYAWPY